MDVEAEPVAGAVGQAGDLVAGAVAGRFEDAAGAEIDVLAGSTKLGGGEAGKLRRFSRSQISRWRSVGSPKM